MKWHFFIPVALAFLAAPAIAMTGPNGKPPKALAAAGTMKPCDPEATKRGERQTGCSVVAVPEPAAEAPAPAAPAGTPPVPAGKGSSDTTNW